MQSVSVKACIITVALLTSVASSTKQRPPAKSTTPLTAEDVAIYRAVLSYYAPQGAKFLNVSNTTYPFDPISPMNHSSDDCLKGIKLGGLDEISRSFHDLTVDVLPEKTMKLVDPKKQSKIVQGNDPDKTMREGKPVHSAVADAFASALFSMSEIAFDQGHQYAVVSYRFWCGSLCGNGFTLVFEKFDGEWRRTDRRCGGWISYKEPHSEGLRASMPNAPSRGTSAP